MYFRSLDCGCEFFEHAGVQRQWRRKHQRLYGLFWREISERDLRKPAFFGSKAGPKCSVDDGGDRLRIGMRRESVFAAFARLREMALEVLFDCRSNGCCRLVRGISDHCVVNFFNISAPCV